MTDLHVETSMQAEASFTVGNRVFYVVCEVRRVKAFGGKAWGTIVSPTAVLVDEDGRIYSISLTGEETDPEEILRLVPTLRERIRSIPGAVPGPR